MRALRGWTGANHLALSALLLAAGLCVAVFVRAWGAEPLPGPVGAAGALRVPQVATAADSGTNAVIATAVDLDPFQPDRTRPVTRYRPGVAVSTTAGTPPPSRPPLPMLRLQGIATLPKGGGIAALSVNGRPAQIVRLGQLIEGLRVTRIRDGAVTLTRPDTTVVVRLPGATSRP